MKEKYIECNVGQTKEAADRQSDKECEKCKHFERNLAQSFCGDCYESEDKYEWEEGRPDTGLDEMDDSSYRVCKTCD